MAQCHLSTRAVIGRPARRWHGRDCFGSVATTLLLLPWPCQGLRLDGASAPWAVLACKLPSAVAVELDCECEGAGVHRWRGAGEKRSSWSVAYNVSWCELAAETLRWREGAVSNQGVDEVDGPSAKRGLRRSVGGIQGNAMALCGYRDRHDCAGCRAERGDDAVALRCATFDHVA
jgi:hypothetical protein